MRKPILLALLALLVSHCAFAQNEIFSAKRIVNVNTAAGRFRHPFAMVMGPDDSLWLTERRGYVMKVSIQNGGKHQLLDIRSTVRFTTSGGGIKQDGMFGIALHPGLNKETGNDFVYIAYCYDSSGLRRVRIVRYEYNRSVPSLSNPVILLRGIHGSDDHNGGRLVIGNYGTSSIPDYKLVYSVGDQGANQFANSCDSIESQYTPTAAQLTAGNRTRYSGKILRLNLDGSIPADNPVINGVRSHVYSFGHRNPQGLVFERNSNNEIVPGGRLYESEQGPATDDEINIINAGRNYGWPRVAGMHDNGWYKYYQWEGHSGCSSYPGECSATQTSSGLPENSFYSPVYQNPIFDLFPATPPGGAGCNWLNNPTLAPSSIAHYPFNKRIPGWENSLLIATLKSSAVYRLKLNSSGNAALSTPDSVIQYFKVPGALNRYRDIVVANDGITFYLLTDSVGGTSGPTAGQDGGVTNRGCILEYKYLGPLLAVGDDPTNPDNRKYEVKMYPNPTSSILNIQARSDVAKPILYKIYDLTGRILLSGNSRRNEVAVNVERLPKGMYIIKLYNGYDILIATEKVVVQ
ncbi:MAG: T9SS type A sorting domain-containing protein [Sphingobacteriaceae bacterium]|nr:MAG: T9SS type A sorting domain-containing protein [Sphingobacteriaceae bacterium]